MKTTVHKCPRCDHHMQVNLNRVYDDKRKLICGDCGECEYMRFDKIGLLSDTMTRSENILAWIIVVGCVSGLLILVAGSLMGMYIFMRGLL